MPRRGIFACRARGLASQKTPCGAGLESTSCGGAGVPRICPKQGHLPASRAPHLLYRIWSTLRGAPHPTSRVLQAPSTNYIATLPVLQTPACYVQRVARRKSSCVAAGTPQHPRYRVFCTLRSGRSRARAACCAVHTHSNVLRATSVVCSHTASRAPPPV